MDVLARRSGVLARERLMQRRHLRPVQLPQVRQQPWRGRLDRRQLGHQRRLADFRFPQGRKDCGRPAAVRYCADEVADLLLDPLELVTLAVLLDGSDEGRLADDGRAVDLTGLRLA